MGSASLLVWALLSASSPAFAQAAANGSIEGVLKDSRGLILPGVTVTVSGPAIVGSRTATTDVDGSYRFPSLPPGTYSVTFEQLGYDKLSREGVVVSAGEVKALDALALAPAPITPPGAEPPGPPVVDPKTAGATTSFGTKQLDGVPSGTSLWAVLDASPGIQMRGYDVAGSHEGQQTRYETFGIRSQNRIVNDGVNTTEGTGGAGGYVDYYAIDEIRVTGQGAGVEMSTPGAQVVSTWKSGSNEFRGLVHGDFMTDDFSNDNLDEDLEARGGTSAEVREAYEYHLGLGGPIVKDRAWFYLAYNQSYVDRPVSGQDPELATDIADVDVITGKINARLSSKDQLIASGHWSFKRQPYRGLSAVVPAESTLAQESSTEAFKLEWQRNWSDRLSTSIAVGHFGYEWQMVPRTDPSVLPARIDTATSVRSGAGWGAFTSNRWKPQSTGLITYNLPTASAGNHELKFGWDWQIDRNGAAWSDSAGAIRYLDNSAYGRATSLGDLFVDRIEFANVPNQGETDHNQHTDLFAQDVWRVNDKLSLTLGVRASRQDVYYGDVANFPLQSDVFTATSAPGTDVLALWGVAPRLGLAYDLSGRGKSVIKAFAGRFYANLGSGIEAANPGGRGIKVYEFLDLDQDGRYGGPQELGRLLEAGGGGQTQVDPSFELAYSDELSLSFEQELAADVAVRFGLVHKRYRNGWDPNVNVAQAFNLTNPITAICTGCPLGLEGSAIGMLTVPDGQTSLVDPRVMNAPLLPSTGGDNTDMSFTTFQVALTRRFRNNFFVTASFDTQSRDELRSPSTTPGPLVADPLAQEWFLNHSTSVTNRQETSYWNAKLLLRYVAAYDIGIALNVRYQSGFPWSPVHYLDVPNVGTKAILLTPLADNRSEDVVLADVRLDKTWRFGGHYGLTAIADAYNLFDVNPATNFVLNTGSRFENVIEWVPGLTLKLGLRLQF